MTNWQDDRGAGTAALDERAAADRRRVEPDALARVARLELRARTVVEGVISGLHRSPHRGYSVEFAQHREYTPGDETRHIDWRLYARSERHFVKQYEEETNLRATLVLDTSSSMDYASAGVSKLDYAATACAALAMLLTHQRDSVGLALFDRGVRSYLPAAGTAPHLREALRRLATAETAPRTGIGAALHDLADRVKRRGLIVVVSDFFDQPADILLGLRHFHHRRHEVVALQVLDPHEVEFPFREPVVFSGLEGEGEMPIEPRSLRNEYLARFRAHVDALRRGCHEIGMDYAQFVTDQPVEKALTDYLSRRRRRA